MFSRHTLEGLLPTLAVALVASTAYGAETAALTTAGKVEGASKALDAIVVSEGPRTMGETVDDTTIQTKLEAGLAKAAGEVARGVNFVKQVHNFITLQP